jgi:hypothetical protein
LDSRDGMPLRTTFCLIRNHDEKPLLVEDAVAQWIPEANQCLGPKGEYASEKRKGLRVMTMQKYWKVMGT